MEMYSNKDISKSTLITAIKENGGMPEFDSEEDYKKFYIDSIDHPDKYWNYIASKFHWYKKYDRIIKGSFPEFEFFSGGYSNVAYNCVDRNAEKNPEKTAIIWLSEDNKERKITYAELKDEVARFAMGLRENGVKKGDVVAIYMSNIPEAFIAVYACYRIGAIYNIIFSGFSANALLERMEDTKPKIVITEDQSVRRGKYINLKNTLDSVRSKVKSINRVIVVKRTGTPNIKMLDNDIYFDDFLKQASGLAEPLPIEANEPGFVIYTSGTTSKPKGIIHSGIGFMVGSYHYVKYSVNLKENDIYWCTADVGWLTFPIYELVGALAHNGTVIAYEGALDYPSIDHFYGIIEKYKVTKLFTAPTLLRMLARYGREKIKNYDLSSLKLISLVGEPLDVKTWHWVYKNIGNENIEINNTYGQTETGGAWTSSIVGITGARPGSCGLPLPGHSYVILDNRGNPVKAGTRGTLVLTQPFPMLARDVWDNHKRYINNYFSVFNGYYCTYDEAMEDEYNHIWVLGRTDDVINVAGHRLSTMEMENSIMSIPEISDAAVIGIDDEIKALIPAAFITLNNRTVDYNEIKNRIKNVINDSIGKFAIPGKIYIISEMPKTRSGKIMRRLLREILSKGDISGDITGLENPESIEKIKNELKNSN